MKVTEKNYDKIIKKLRRITNRFKLYQIYYIYKNRNTHGKFDILYKNIFRDIYIGRPYIKNMKYNPDKKNSKEYIKKFQFKIISSFFDVTEHYIHTMYRNGFFDVDTMPYDTYQGNMSTWQNDAREYKEIYEKTHPMISIDMGNDSVLVLNEGDAIRFYPLGFISITKVENDIIYPGEINKHKYLFATNVKNRIKDIDYELKKREEEERIRKLLRCSTF